MQKIFALTSAKILPGNRVTTYKPWKPLHSRQQKIYSSTIKVGIACLRWQYLGELQYETPERDSVKKKVFFIVCPNHAVSIREFL